MYLLTTSSGSPNSATRPWCSQSASVAIVLTELSPWVTSTIVRPSPMSCAVFSAMCALKRGVASGERLVDEQDLGIEEHGDRRREAHAHAARVGVHRQVEVLVELRELADLVGELGQALGRQPARQPAEGDVLAAGQCRAEPEAGREQVQATPHDDATRLREGARR